MNSGIPVQSHQRSNYEQAYRSVTGDYGIPDRKITDGKDVTGKRIACVGVGAGSDVWFLAKDNELIGIDYANSGLAIAEDHGINVLTSDLNVEQRLPLDDCSVDIVILKDILEHLMEPLPVLKDCSRVLRPGGWVIISVPNHFYLPIRMRSFFGKGLMYNNDHAGEYDEWSYMHIRFFTFRGFKRFLKAAGFEPAKWYFDFGHLAHYHQPEMWFEPQLWKIQNKIPLSARASRAMRLLYPAWRIFNALFPKSLRGSIVALAPGLLCSGFYVRCVPMQADH